MMEVTLDQILDFAKAKVGSLMVIDHAKGALRIVAARGFPSEIMDQVKKLTLMPGHGIAGHVYQTGQPYYLRDPGEDTLFIHQNITMGFKFQFLSLPLRNNDGTTFGVLNIHFPTEAVMGSKDLERLSQLANRLMAQLMESRPKPLPC